MTCGYKKNLVLPILYVLLFMVAFVSGLQNPFGVIVRTQFGVSNTLAQLGNLANFVAYAIMGYPAGLLLFRYGYRKTASAATVLGFLGVAVQLVAALVSDFTCLIAGAFLAGFSMCMLNTLVNPLLNIIGGGGKGGNRLLQFGGASYTVGGMAVPYLVGMLVAEKMQLSAAVPALVLSMTIFAGAFIYIHFVSFPEPDRGVREAVDANPDGRKRFGCLSFRHFRLGALAVFLYMGVEVGIANTANLYLTHGAGLLADSAGKLIGVYWLFMIAGRFIGGLAGSRISPAAMLASVSAVSLVLVAAAIFVPESLVTALPLIPGNVPVNVIPLLLCGLCVAMMWGSIFNLAVEGLGRYTSSASGVFMTMVCGGGIIPAVQGFLSDCTGYMQSFWLTVCCLVYLVYYALSGSRPESFSKNQCSS